MQWDLFVQGGPGNISLRVDPASTAKDGLMQASDKQTLAALTSATPTIGNTLKSGLVDNQVASLFSVDMSQVSDNSWGAYMFFTMEATDGVNTQVVTGRVILNIARASNGTVNTSQAQQSGTASTSGTLNATFAWSVVGSVCTLQVTPASTLTPTDLHVNYYVPYASHTNVITVIP